MKIISFTCEYLRGNQHCREITNDIERWETRRKSCSRDEQDYCCYFCEHHGTCKISCDLKGNPETVPKSPNVDMEIIKCQKRMEKLANLFADGKIGEQSYATAARTLEKKLARLNQAKENPNAALSIYEPLPSETDESEVDPIEKPTDLWYLAPFFFGIIGGLVGYVGTKDRDENMASGLLIIGMIWTLLLVFIGWLLITSH